MSAWFLFGATNYHGKFRLAMSALGQNQTSDWLPLMSAIPPKADIVRHGCGEIFALPRQIAHHFAAAGVVDHENSRIQHKRIRPRNHLVLGQPLAGSRYVYVAPDTTAELHNSLTSAWKLIEWIPKSMKYNEWPRLHLLGYYIPCGEPRMIAGTPTPRIHQSVLDRKDRVPDCRPINFPQQYEVEP